MVERLTEAQRREQRYALDALKKVWRAWCAEQAESIDVVEATGRYLDTLETHRSVSQDLGETG